MSKLIAFTSEELEMVFDIVVDKYNRKSNDERIHGIAVDRTLLTLRDKLWDAFIGGESNEVRNN